MAKTLVDPSSARRRTDKADDDCRQKPHDDQISEEDEDERTCHASRSQLKKKSKGVEGRRTRRTFVEDSIIVEDGDPSDV